jgi:hypothetical protein
LVDKCPDYIETLEGKVAFGKPDTQKNKDIA